MKLIYDEQCGMMEMVLDVDAIIEEVKTVRDNSVNIFNRYNIQLIDL